MLKRPIPKSAKLGLTGVLALIIAGTILLPMAAAQKASGQANPEQNSVRLVVGKDRMTFEGQEVTFDQLPLLLEKVPNRGETVFEIAITTKKIPFERYDKARNRADKLVEQFGFKHLSLVGVHRLGSKAGSEEKKIKPATRARPKPGEPGPVGKWQSVDFVQEIEDFKPGKKLFTGELFLKKLKIYEGWQDFGRL